MDIKLILTNYLDQFNFDFYEISDLLKVWESDDHSQMKFHITILDRTNKPHETDKKTLPPFCYPLGVEETLYNKEGNPQATLLKGYYVLRRLSGWTFIQAYGAPQPNEDYWKRVSYYKPRPLVVWENFIGAGSHLFAADFLLSGFTNDDETADRLKSLAATLRRAGF